MCGNSKISCTFAAIFFEEIMNYSFFDFLMLIGSLGLFLFGMKIMSEGLQKTAGDGLRSILAAMTRNRVRGMFTGILITTLIQASAATIVMVVSFVNAGLMTLVQSITVIMGANIGTTATAWIISLLGFKISISEFSIPMMAIAIPLIFSSKNRRKSIGEFIMGFALLFMGLDLLKNNMPDLQSNPEMLSFLSNYTDMGYWSVLIFLGIGTIITLIVQSSSATMAITMIMCAKGWIPFELGAAMVLGENIGTTVTANIAAIPANVSAKRAALSHLIFNIIGVIWMLIVFYPFLKMVTGIITHSGSADPNQMMTFLNDLDPRTYAMISNPDATGLSTQQMELKSQFGQYQIATSISLSLFHTLFNLINTFVLIWFVKTIAKIVSYLIPQKVKEEEFQLKHISSGLFSTSELSLLQARKEIFLFGERTERMFTLVRELYDETNNDFTKNFSKIEKYEQTSDRIEVEIATYLTNVAKGRLSENSKLQLQTMLRVISEIESVADGCYNIARTIVRRRDDKSVYTAEMNENIKQMMNLIDESIRHMKKLLNSDLPMKVNKDDFARSVNLENDINNLRNELKLQNVANVKEQKYDYQASVTYMDMIVELEKMGDYIINIAEALNEL